jgi:hypothetical protein
LFSRETRTSGHFNANFRNDKNVDRLAAASSDFDIFNLFDTDDIELSQLCEKMDTENNLINTADIFDILICLIQMTLNCHSFVKKWIQKIT